MKLVYIVCANREEARGIGRRLVEQRLAACVNWFPIESCYWWNGELTEDQEVVLLAKTVEANVPALQKAVAERHSYEVPAIFVLAVSEVAPTYLDWLTREVRAAS